MVAALGHSEQSILQHALKNITFLTNPDNAKKEVLQTQFVYAYRAFSLNIQASSGEYLHFFASST